MVEECQASRLVSFLARYMVSKQHSGMWTDVYAQLNQAEEQGLFDQCQCS